MFGDYNHNYSIAWNAFVSRYNNKKVIVQAHVKSIFDLEVMIVKYSNKLRQLKDTGHIRTLETLGY